MAYAVRLLLLAAVAAICRAVPFGNTAATAAFGEVGTTDADATTLAADAAVTTLADSATIVTASEDTAVTTDDPRMEHPTPQQPGASSAPEDNSSASSSSSEESSESSEAVKTERPESTTYVAGAQDADKEESQTKPQDTNPDDSSSDTDDDENLFSNVKERYAMVPGLKLRKQRCAGVASGRGVGGVCLDKGECLLKRGLHIGHCGLLGTCCYFQHTCGEVSHYKVSHFASPSSIPPECDLRIVVHNRDVCQIRVDFEEFSLEQPERDSNPDDEEALGGYRCVRDSFTVEAPASRNLGFDSLCGQNRGQHIYIPVNATLGGTALRLHFRLFNRSVPVNGNLLSPPRWLLRITQLECAAAEYDYSSIVSTLASAGYQSVNKHVIAATDADLLAPQGCLQYFPQRSGTYMSFNYPAELPTRRYLANQHYAICFRRRPDDCGIRHTVSGIFRLDFNAYATSQTYVDRNCDRRDTALDYTYTSDDYFFVPNGIISPNAPSYAGGPLATKFCGLALLTGDSVTSFAAGPFHVYFHSDDLTFRDHIMDQGFQFTYHVLSGSCRLSDPGTYGGGFAG